MVVWRELGDQRVFVGHDEGIDLLLSRVILIKVKYRCGLFHVIIEDGEDAAFSTLDLGRSEDVGVRRLVERDTARSEHAGLL